jgi:hypothetical protein
MESEDKVHFLDHADEIVPQIYLGGIFEFISKQLKDQITKVKDPFYLPDIIASRCKEDMQVLNIGYILSVADGCTRLFPEVSYQKSF